MAHCGQWGPGGPVVLVTLYLVFVGNGASIRNSLKQNGGKTDQNRRPALRISEDGTGASIRKISTQNGAPILSAVDSGDGGSGVSINHTLNHQNTSTTTAFQILHIY